MRRNRRPVWTAGLIAASFASVTLLAAAARAQDCPDVAIVVDNDIGGSGYSEQQANNWASRPTGSCTGTYRYLSHDDSVAPNNDGSRKGKAIWKPPITVTGNYDVEISYRATENRTNDADYYVHDDNGGVTHRVIDQAHEGDCTKVSLGTFYCVAGGDCRVVLDGTDDNKSDSADATTFRLVDCDDPPPPSEACDGIASAPGYELCAETETTCAGVYSNGAGCEAFCAAAGMECVARYGGEPGCSKEAQTPIPCDEVNDHQSDWCECAYPPGYEPPTGAGGSGGQGGTATGGGDAATSSATGTAGVTATVSAGAGGGDGAGGSGAPAADDQVASGCSVRTSHEGGGTVVLLALGWLLGLRRRARRGSASWRRASRPRSVHEPAG